MVCGKGRGVVREIGLRIWVYCLLLWKRMWKTHKILLLFCLAPFAVAAAKSAWGEETAPLRVAVWIEGIENTSPVEAENDSGEAAEAENDGGKSAEAENDGGESLKAGAFLREVQNQLREHDGVIQFVFFPTEEEVRQEVAAARAECGYCIPADLMEHLEKKRLKNVIKAYESPRTSMQRLCEEVLFAEIFLSYEKMTFGEQAAELIGTKLEDANSERIAARAEELFEKYLYNGSTFQFVYDAIGETETGAEQQREIKESKDGGIFRIRGSLALLIFTAGLCGTLDVLEDEKQKRTLRLKGGAVFRFLTIYLPVFVMSAVTLICLPIAGEWKGIAAELVMLGRYQLILLPYCFLLKHLCGTQERLAAAIPVLILLTAVVCPVFADLAQFVPAFRILEKIFPAAYYLSM